MGFTMRVNEAFHEAARGVWSDRASGTSRGVRRGVLRSSRGRRTLEVWLDPGRARGGTQGVAQREGVAQRGVREGVPVHGWAISLGKHAGIVQARPASDGFCSGDLVPPVGIRQVALARILRDSPSPRPPSKRKGCSLASSARSFMLAVTSRGSLAIPSSRVLDSGAPRAILPITRNRGQRVAEPRPSFPRRADRGAAKRGIPAEPRRGASPRSLTAEK